MVKKSYRTLFKDPTGFKEKVLYCLFDLDRRIKELTGLDELKKVFSLKTHTHDSRYSLFNHTHTGYVTLEDFPTLVNTTLSNSHICYIKPFTVTGGSTIECDVEPTNVLFLEDLNNSIFTVSSINGTTVTYEQTHADENRIYHLLYYGNTLPEPEEPEEPEGTITITVQYASGHRNNYVLLSALIDDIDGHSINDGIVDFYVDDVKVGTGHNTYGVFRYYYIIPNDTSYGIHTVKVTYRLNDEDTPIEATGTLTVLE